MNNVCCINNSSLAIYSVGQLRCFAVVLVLESYNHLCVGIFSLSYAHRFLFQYFLSILSKLVIFANTQWNEHANRLFIYTAMQWPSLACVISFCVLNWRHMYCGHAEICGNAVCFEWTLNIHSQIYKWATLKVTLFSCKWVSEITC